MAKRGSNLVSEAGFGHAAQPKGDNTGAGSKKARTFGTAKGKASGTGSQPHPEVGNVGGKDRGSHLVGEGGAYHSDQPQGKSIGAGRDTPNWRGFQHGGERHIFKPPTAANAHGFGHPANLRSGPLRMSGHSGAHRIGKKK